jgi:hypothetical protein
MREGKRPLSKRYPQARIFQLPPRFLRRACCCVTQLPRLLFLPMKTMADPAPHDGGSTNFTSVIPSDTYAKLSVRTGS